MPLSREWILKNEQAQANHFFDIVSGQVLPPRPTEAWQPGFVKRRKRSASVWFAFLCIWFLLNIVVPLAVFILLIPLFFDLPHEIWMTYYWGFHLIVALTFAEIFTRVGLGDVLPRWLLFFGGFVAVGMCITGHFISTCIRNNMLVDVSGVFIGLLFPVFGRLIMRRTQDYFRHYVSNICVMFWGSLPTMLSAGIFVLQARQEFVGAKMSTAIGLSVWIVVPMFTKAIYRKVFTEAAPNAKMVYPTHYRFYVHFSFSTLGVIYFVDSPIRLVQYSLTILVPMIIAALRGMDFTRHVLRSASRCWRQALPEDDSEMVRYQRLELLLEIFGETCGRTTACIWSGLMLSANISGYDNTLMKTRRSLLTGADMPTGLSVHIIRRGKLADTFSIPMLVVCAILMWFLFFLFMVVLPKIWRTQARDLRRIHPESQAMPRGPDSVVSSPRSSSCGSSCKEVPSPSVEQLPISCNDEVGRQRGGGFAHASPREEGGCGDKALDSCKVKEVLAHTKQVYWLSGETNEEVVKHEVALISKFMKDYFGLMFWTVVFVMFNALASVNLASALLGLSDSERSDGC